MPHSLHHPRQEARSSPQAPAPAPRPSRAPKPETPARVVGRPLRVWIEDHHDPDRIDHVLAEIDTGDQTRLLPFVLSINTRSHRNLAAGFDPRVRVGRLRQPGLPLPQPGICEGELLDYRLIEEGATIFFETLSRPQMEHLLLGLFHRCLLVEAWGFLYGSPRRGLHQIHSRRASCAVREDLTGQDGALRFYFPHPENPLLLLMKFCGQP